MSGKPRCVFRPARTARLLPRAPPHTARPPNLPKMAAPSRTRDSRTPGVWPRRRHGCFFREASLGKTLLRPHVHPIARRRTESPEKSEFPECDCDCECLWSQSHNPGSRIAQHMIAATESARRGRPTPTTAAVHRAEAGARRPGLPAPTTSAHTTPPLYPPAYHTSPTGKRGSRSGKRAKWGGVKRVRKATS